MNLEAARNSSTLWSLGFVAQLLVLLEEFQSQMNKTGVRLQRSLLKRKLKINHSESRFRRLEYFYVHLD